MFRQVTQNSAGSLGILILLIMLGVNPAAAETRIKCASTTSTQNSGLLDYILPLFEKKTGIKVDVVAVGTGAAIEIGKRGDADVIFVHAREQELKAVEEGFFVNRHDVMYNDFVIIGPSNDPAKIKSVRSALDAFKKIAGSGSSFVSRGDKSGTHTKELSIWKKAAIEPQAGNGISKSARAWKRPSALPMKSGPIRSPTAARGSPRRTRTSWTWSLSSKATPRSSTSTASWP